MVKKRFTLHRPAALLQRNILYFGTLDAGGRHNKVA
jgi:hypothetical protein